MGWHHESRAAFSHDGTEQLQFQGLPGVCLIACQKLKILKFPDFAQIDYPFFPGRFCRLEDKLPWFSFGIRITYFFRGAPVFLDILIPICQHFPWLPCQHRFPTIFRWLSRRPGLVASALALTSLRRFLHLRRQRFVRAQRVLFPWLRVRVFLAQPGLLRELVLDKAYTQLLRRRPRRSRTFSSLRSHIVGTCARAPRGRTRARTHHERPCPCHRTITAQQKKATLNIHTNKLSKHSKVHRRRFSARLPPFVAKPNGAAQENGTRHPA